MQKIIEYWRERSTRQQTLLAGAFIATFLTVAAFAWIAGSPQMSLLYGGLEQSQAGALVAELDRQKIPYQIKGETIWVPEKHRDRLRLDLAAKGLPEGGAAGYELLDGLSGFGTTSQMFDAAYWRAKEGELARTILASPNVKSARVHLAVPGNRSYRRDPQTTASVTVISKGHEISAEQARAFRFLIASGVPGMSPEAVTVIDSQKGIIDTDDPTTGDRQNQMKRDVERLLTAHVGNGNAIVEVSLEVETRAEQISERRFDPSERALISQELEESTDQSSEAAQAAVTAASNLPDNPAAADGQHNSSRETSRQRANFEVSETRRDITSGPGDIRRMSVAVLVNGVEGTDTAGKPTIIPRSEAELEALGALVASTVGLKEERGDVLTIKSLPFAQVTENGSFLSKPNLIERLALNDLAKLTLIGIFATIFALLTIRPLIKARNDKALVPLLDDSSPPLVQSAQISAPEAAAPASPEMPVAAEDAGYSIEPPESLLRDAEADGEDPTKRLRRLMRERHGESVRVLSNWITERKART